MIYKKTFTVTVLMGTRLSLFWPSHTNIVGQSSQLNYTSPETASLQNEKLNLWQVSIVSTANNCAALHRTVWTETSGTSILCAFLTPPPQPWQTHAEKRKRPLHTAACENPSGGTQEKETHSSDKKRNTSPCCPLYRNRGVWQDTHRRTTMC